MEERVDDSPALLEVPGLGVVVDEIQMNVKQDRNPTDALGTFVRVGVLMVSVAALRSVSTRTIQSLVDRISFGEVAGVLSNLPTIVAPAHPVRADPHVKSAMSAFDRAADVEPVLES